MNERGAATSRVSDEMLNVVKLLAHNINELISETAETFEPIVRDKGLELKIVLSSAPAIAVCDRDKLCQVVVNLTNNAVKFCEHGRVTLRTELLAKSVRVYVQDEGPGISPEDQAKLFKSFSQVRSSGQSKEGTGLGLAICRKIIEHHNGRIGLESAPGKGATFYFEIPRDMTDGQRL